MTRRLADSSSAATRRCIVSIPHTGTEIPADVRRRPRLALARAQGRRLVDRRALRLRRASSARPSCAPRSRARSSTSTAIRPAPRSIPARPRPSSCPTTTFDGEPLYRPARAPDAAEIAERRARLLRALPRRARGRDRAPARDCIRRVVLYDCHSIRSVIPRLFDGELPDVQHRHQRRRELRPGAAARRSTPSAPRIGLQPRRQRPLQGRLDHAPLRPARATASTRCRWSSPAAAICDEPTGRRRPRRTGRPPYDAERARADLRAALTRDRCDACAATSRAKPAGADHDPPRQRPRHPRAARHRAHRQELADRSAAAHADEQPRPGRRRAARASSSSMAASAARRATGTSFDRIVATLQRLEDDETLLVQSGKPVGVFRTHADAPRVLIANSNLVPHWATWEHFNELDRKGLMMYGQMTAGSWIYIGSQGIVQGTYETFVEVGRQHYGGDLAGQLDPDRGLGGMGGAQPLAATMAGASLLAVECQPIRIEMRLRTGYLDAQADDLDEALAIIERAGRGQEAGLGRPARQRRRDLARAGAPRRAARRGHRPDLGARSGQRLSAEGLDAGRVGERARERSRRRSSRRRKHSMARACARHARLPQARACRRSTTATTSARWRRTRASPTPSTSRASCRPISARCSAAASARSAGRRCRAIRRTSTAPTPR